MMTNKRKPFDVLLFDLGGVFIQLSGAPRMMELTRGRLTMDELWEKWLSSPSVKNFESGRSSSREFAIAMVDEFGLYIAPSQFLEEFTEWSSTLFPGARRLLNALAPNYTLVSLSNTNHIHWAYFRDHLKLPDLFHHNFPSHETGHIKPDREAFTHVVGALGCDPKRVLFLDDMAENVAGAQQAGITAVQVKGMDQVLAALNEKGVLKERFFQPYGSPMAQKAPASFRTP